MRILSVGWKWLDDAFVAVLLVGPWLTKMAGRVFPSLNRGGRLTKLYNKRIFAPLRKASGLIFTGIGGWLIYVGFRKTGQAFNNLGQSVLGGAVLVVSVYMLAHLITTRVIK